MLTGRAHNQEKKMLIVQCFHGYCAAEACVWVWILYSRPQKHFLLSMQLTTSLISPDYAPFPFWEIEESARNAVTHLYVTGVERLGK